MVANGYYCDQAFIGFAFLVMLVLYAMQLLIQLVVSKQGKMQQDALIYRQHSSGPSVSVSVLRVRSCCGLPVLFDVLVFAPTPPPSSSSVSASASAPKSSSAPLSPSNTSRVSSPPRVVVASHPVRTARVGQLHKLFHTLGAACCLLKLICYMDPYCQLGIYGLQVTLFFTNNTSSLLVAAASFGGFLPINLVYVMSFDSGAPPFYRYALVFASALILLAGNVSVISVDGSFHGSFSLAFAVCVAFVVTVLDFGMYNLRRGVREMMGQREYERHQSIAAEDEDGIPAPRRSVELANPSHLAIVSSLRRMTIFEVLGNLLALAVIGFQLYYFYYWSLQHPVDSVGAQVDGNDYWSAITSGYALGNYAQLFALIVMLWYTYLPLGVLFSAVSVQLRRRPAARSSHEDTGKLQSSPSSLQMSSLTSLSNPPVLSRPDSSVLELNVSDLVTSTSSSTTINLAHAISPPASDGHSADIEEEKDKLENFRDANGQLQEPLCAPTPSSSTLIAN